MEEKKTPGLRAALPDDAMVSAEIAALYLRMSPAELAGSQKPKRTDGRVEKSGKPQSAPTTYLLGEIRALAARQPPPDALDTLAKAGLMGWMSSRLPFFAELEPRVKRGRRVLIGSAWEPTDAEREARFAELAEGRIRFTWITSSEAVASLWSDHTRHRAFAARGLALLDAEKRAIDAVLEATSRLPAA